MHARVMFRVSVDGVSFCKTSEKYGRGFPPLKAVVCQRKYDHHIFGGKPPCSFRAMRAISPVAPSDFDRVITVYRSTQTALLGDPYCTGYDRASEAPSSLEELSEKKKNDVERK